ncbi:MAG TPA: energy transducer TonB [Terriglobia bacterium]|nr:energy transducer TonB [Terriglobia bacterium]
MVRTVPFCALAIAMAVISAAAGQQPNRAEMLAHLKNVTTWSELAKRDVPPVEFEIHFKAAAPDGGWLEGTYRKLWYGPKRYREEIQSSVYSSTLVSTEAGVWEKSSPDEEPFGVDQAARVLLGYGSQINQGDKLGNPKDLNLNGKRLVCSTVKRPGRISVDFCLDADSLIPASIAWKSGGQVVDHTNFTSWSGWLAPKDVQSRLNGKPEVIAELTKLGPPSEGLEAALAPLSGPDVLQHPECEDSNYVGPIGISRRTIPFSPFLSQIGEGGIMRVWAVVGREGRLHNITVVQSVGSNLDKAAVLAMKEWRFKPATCGGVPVSVPVDYDFHFGQ